MNISVFGGDSSKCAISTRRLHFVGISLFSVLLRFNGEMIVIIKRLIWKSLSRGLLIFRHIRIKSSIATPFLIHFLLLLPARHQRTKMNFYRLGNDPLNNATPPQQRCVNNTAALRSSSTPTEIVSNFPRKSNK